MELLMEQVSRFKGDYPDIPLPADIDREALGKVDFVTLPVGRVDAQSQSGRVYKRPAIESLVRQINEKRPEGGWGHLATTELTTRYDPPAIRWLAATLDEHGVAWAKGLPLTEQAREHFRVARATNARVGTSIWGTPPTASEGVNVLDFELFRLDIADPTRVGIAETAAKPKLTSEMEGGMPDNNDALAELRQERDAARQELGEVKSKLASAQGTLTGARAAISEMPMVNAYVNISESGDNLVDVIRSILQNLAKLQAQQMVAAIDATVTEMVKLESLRPVVWTMLTGLVDRAAIAEMVKGQPAALPGIISEMAKAPDVAALLKQRLTAILESSAIKTLAQKISVAEQGPAYLGAGNGDQGSANWREELAKKAGEIAKSTGMMGG
jgi:hypothetical protein